MSLANATSRRAEDLGNQPLPRRSLASTETPVQWATRRYGAWIWTTRDDWMHRIHENGCPDWTDLPAESAATMVKLNDGRQVWRIQLGNDTVYAKLYQPPQGWSVLRRWLVGSDSARELRVAEYARLLQIRTVQPVASADASRVGSGPVSILLTLGLPDAVPLNEVWQQLDPKNPRTRNAKNLIVDQVARLIAHAHQNGFEHTDLHAGNILLDDCRRGDYQALFVDLHNIRVGRPVSDRAVIRNLAQFHQWFRLRATLTDRLRFLDRYLHWRNAYENSGSFGRRLDYSATGLRNALDKAIRAHANTLYAQRDRRTSRSGRYFTRIKLGSGWRGFAFLKCKQPMPGSSVSDMTFTAANWREWLADPLRWTQPDQTRYSIKKSASGTVSRCSLSVDGNDVDVICKRSHPRTLYKRLKNLFRRSRALRTWELGNALLHRQIPTARPVAVVERRRLGMLLDSLIFTEYLEHAHDLDTVLTVELREIEAVRQQRIKRQIIAALATLIRSFHARGFVHRDLKAPNVMVQWDATAGQPPRILLVDLDGISQKRSPRPQDWLRALSRLNVSLDHCRRVTLADRLRFLKACLVGPGNPDPEWREVWQQIARMTVTKRKQQQCQAEKMIAKYGRV